MQHQHQLWSKKLSTPTNIFAATALKRERERERWFSRPQLAEKFFGAGVLDPPGVSRRLSTNTWIIAEQVVL